MPQGMFGGGTGVPGVPQGLLGCCRGASGVPQGLSLAKVEEASRPLHALLVLLASPSELLVRMWESADDQPPRSSTADEAHHGDAPLGTSAHSILGLRGSPAGALDGDGDGGPAEGTAPRLSDKQRIARVLSRRSDGLARRWQGEMRAAQGGLQAWSTRGAGAPAPSAATSNAIVPVAGPDAPGLRARLGYWLS